MTAPMTNERIDQALDFVLQTANDTKGFVLEQAPLVAREIVAWTLWSGVIQAVVCVSLLIVIGRLVRNATARERADGCGGDPLDIITIVAGSLAIIFIFGAACFGIGQATKSLVAPRLVIIDTLRSAAK